MLISCSTRPTLVGLILHNLVACVTGLFIWTFPVDCIQCVMQQQQHMELCVLC